MGCLTIWNQRDVLKLREIQRVMYRSLVERDDRDIAIYVRSDGIAAADRLSVYRNTFYGTLTHALRLSYPAVHRLVGHEFFEGAGHGFIETHPPRSAYLDEYGSGFADSLRRLPGARSVPYLFDVARLEWAVVGALHAPDATPLDTAALLKIDPSEHERVCLARHPSLELLRASYPVDTIWRAVLEENDAALAAIDLRDAPVWLLVELVAIGINVARVTEAAYRFTSALVAGRPLGEAIDVASEIDVSSLLAEHLAAGRFVAYSVAESRDAVQLSTTVR